MGRPDEAVNHLQQGMTLSEVAHAMGISLKSVAGYLFKKVGEGAIRRSDMLFAIPKETRDLIEDCLITSEKKSCLDVYYAARKQGRELDRDEINIYMTLRDARISMGDMYEFITEIEMKYHRMIKSILQNEYGDHEKGWWRKGVPDPVRKACALAREEDREPVDEIYCYTTFIQLKDIFEKNWKIFSKKLPQIAPNEKKQFLKELVRLNRIRNSVMHPVKGVRPTEDDFEFVRQVRIRILEGIRRD